MSAAVSEGEQVKLLIKTVDFAAKKHAAQRRKDAEKTPYINHPVGVANILANEGGVSDVTVLQAALLHDTVEDTDTSYEELVAYFGETVANIVMEETDDKTLPKAERKQKQVERIEKMSREAKMVKLADKLYNLRDLNRATPEGWSEERVGEYFKWAKSVTGQIQGVNQALELELNKVYDARNV
ncbi:guanosine-3',5'-bis(diphosphate) 3'-pyrophosphohydrolase MESH1-like [Symsagittifera roscoffensis]|uniref:guanosine-3',5'-bis(diphosphate) 3'-pyrophosphohydrolase MESH1-like n=1 Tax=Symsagittifera roscoffensis TaxID=84072 RepID=UPI00307C1EDD